MGQTSVPRMQGDDYQARFFWLQACRLFLPYTKVFKVGYEVSDIKSFDDVVIHYRVPVVDERDSLIQADYYQVKFHMDQRSAFTWKALMDPEFISAKSVSILQRLKAAQSKFEPNGSGARFYIVAPWTIHPDDSLGILVDNNGGALRLEVLFDGGGPRSAIGKIRIAWRDHLGLSNDDELRKVLLPLRIKANAEDLLSMRTSLNIQLQLAGMKPVDEGCRVHPYDDLIKKTRSAGRFEFTAADIEEMCSRELLWVGKPLISEPAIPLGIRSFVNWAEFMEDRTKAMLPLESYFDNRTIREPRLWNEIIVHKLIDFVSRNVRAGCAYKLYLDTHTSIAFAAGYFVDPKSGTHIVPVQSTIAGKMLYRPDPKATTGGHPLWSHEEIIVNSAGSDVALALSVTYPILSDVRAYVEHNLPSVGRILCLSILPQPGSNSVRDGTHALFLAQEAASMLKEKRTALERTGTLHLFSSAPNSLIFFLGRLARSFGCCQLYEYDFETNSMGAYQPSIMLPLKSVSG